VHFSPLRVRTFAARPRVSGSRGAPALFFPFVRGFRAIELDLVADPTPTHDQANQEEHQKNDEQNPGDLSGGSGYARKAEHTGDKADDQKCYRPIKHCLSSFYLMQQPASAAHDVHYT